MPRPEEIPPNKTVEQEKSDLTIEINEMFENEVILITRYNQMITHLINQLAIARLEIRDLKCNL